MLKKSHLYVIADRRVLRHKPLSDTVRKIRDSGVDIIQLRDKESKKELILKEAYQLRKLLLNTGAIFIINDHLDIAKIVDSDGIHLGQADPSVEIARKLLGKDKLIGVSCHSLNQAIDAEDKGADYISIGPIFKTPTKPEYKAIGLGLIKKIKKSIHIPFFAIGGIDENNISMVLSAGAKRVALCRAIFQSKNISFATKGFSNILHAE